MDRPVLAELSLDLQIYICEFLHPFQILALRRTCRAFHEATSRRIVWIHALHRICHENSLFLPTFPIPDMSVAELERASTAPRRWIALSSSNHRNSDRFLLPTRTTRLIKSPISSMNLRGVLGSTHLGDLYLVPGGRYLVTIGLDCCSLGVWDLGYRLDDDMSWGGEPSKMWATTVDYVEKYRVHPTPDGLGIRILTCSLRHHVLSVFEIYPQQENSKLVKIAELILKFQDNTTCSLNGNRVVIYGRKTGTVIIWDFIANTVASWSINNSDLNQDKIARVTDTAIVILHKFRGRDSINFSLSIFQIPPLTTKTPLHIDEHLPKVAPILTYKFPKTARSYCEKLDAWYSGDLGSLPLYCDDFESRQGDAHFCRCKIDFAPDLKNISLVPVSNLIMHQQDRYRQNFYSKVYRICDARPVYIDDHYSTVEALTSSASSGTSLGLGLTSECHDSSQTPSVHVNMTPISKSPGGSSSFCPASGRLVYTVNRDLVICDFL